MGRVSRDARLCFVMLWTLADDEGRLRGNSRMLASLLFPYDDDARELIGDWLGELEAEECIEQYEVDGNSYVQITKWLEHQKIDRATKSKIPPFDERSRNLSKPREASSLDQGRDQDQGKDRRTKEGTDARSAEADETATALQAYNDLAKDLNWPQAQLLTPKRRSALKARLAECGGIEGWRAAMAKARESPFLRGDGGRDAEHANWSPDLDFFLQQSKFARLMEGAYDQRNNNRRSTGFDAIHEGARRAAGLDRGGGQGMEGSRGEQDRLAVLAHSAGGV